jgi:predicted Zn-dependent protease
VATDAFGAARSAFKTGDYVTAQMEVEKAIKAIPDDPMLHEFRALTQFAQGKYKDEAATLYAVLARGPGWDWQTMQSLYPDTDTYTRQLRALEAYIREHPSDSAARFDVAYHYLVTQQRDAAVQQLQAVVQVTPQNKLAADMLRALTSTAVPATGQPPKAAQ